MKTIALALIAAFAFTSLTACAAKKECKPCGKTVVAKTK